MIVPPWPPIDPAAILLADDGPLAKSGTGAAEEELTHPSSSNPLPPLPRKRTKTVDLKSLPRLRSCDPPYWRRHLHWLLALALIPLIVSLLSGPDKASFVDRIKETFDRATPEERDRIIERWETAQHEGDKSMERILPAFPDQRLRGAFLRSTTKGHYYMALLASVLYMAFFMFLAADGTTQPTHVLLYGLFTATIGVGFLLLVQLIASCTQDRMPVGANPVTLIILVFKLIAYSYSAALNPDNGFILSFLGFAAGVGLWEEFVKAVPLFWLRSSRYERSWRSMLICSLASGAGFGIAEGIIYSSRYYNGITGLEAYLVRFISCVALHSIWSGSVAILLYIRHDLFDKIERWYQWILPILFVIGLPAVLHGLYDTCLKKDMNGVALLVAFASFGYLAYLFSRLQTVDDRAALKAMLREYERRKGLA